MLGFNEAPLALFSHLMLVFHEIFTASMNVSIPTSLPPHTLKFLQWLKKTDGRDKLYRLFAYSSKIPVELLKESNPDLSKKLKKGASSIGLSRKLLRMFRVLTFIQDFLQAFNAEGDLYEKYLNCLKATSLSIWMAVDHIQWFAKAGYLELKDEKQLSLYHSRAWFFGLFFGLVLNVYKLYKGMQKGKMEKSKELKLQRGALKNFLDLWIPVARLEWLPINDAVVGVFGTMTSIIGIQDTWP